MFWLLGCASPPENVVRAASTAFQDKTTTALGRIVTPAVARHPEDSGFGIIDTGKQAFVLRTLLADAAERAIYAQYYIWNSDRSGKLLAERLLRAAERGVRVRILLDDFSVEGRDPQLSAHRSCCACADSGD